MLRGALRDCPDELWEKRLWTDQPDQWVAAGFSAFWYLGYHTLFWLDLYLTGAEESFAPPSAFDLVEMEPGEVLPRIYTREELLRYLEYCRRRCQETIDALSAEQAYRVYHFAVTPSGHWLKIFSGDFQPCSRSESHSSAPKFRQAFLDRSVSHNGPSAL